MITNSVLIRKLAFFFEHSTFLDPYPRSSPLVWKCECPHHNMIRIERRKDKLIVSHRYRAYNCYEFELNNRSMQSVIGFVNAIKAKGNAAVEQAEYLFFFCLAAEGRLYIEEGNTFSRAIVK